ncbi:MAG: phosphatidate cytidylyltransferase [Calditrichaeota bacterium]|nr:phosphatidate cytidylyltransferase [Calditrichota bacterium]
MKKNGLAARLLVASWGIPLLLALTYLGGWWTTILMMAIALLAQREYYRLWQAQNHSPIIEPALLLGVIIVGLWQVAGMEALGWALAVAFILLAFTALAAGRKHIDMVITFAGLCYPPLLGGSFLAVRNYEQSTPDEGRWIAIGLWCTIWLADTAAYAGGRLFGKHPLAPKISPQKTIEGFFLGFIGAALTSALGWGLDLFDLTNAVALWIAAGLFGQFGDLVESQLKRETAVKDSGTFLPGHGGILDRFDSLFIAAPTMAMFLLIRILGRF